MPIIKKEKNLNFYFTNSGKLCLLNNVLIGGCLFVKIRFDC